MESRLVETFGDGAMRSQPAAQFGRSRILARLEGDEFAILLPGIGHDGATVASREILDALAAPFPVGSLEVHPTAGAGIGLYPEHGAEVEELLRCAAIALHHAKIGGRNEARAYLPALTAAIQKQFALEADTQGGLRPRIRPLLPPKIDLATGMITGAEALLRWQHPRLGLLTPDRFIGLAEKTGFIMELGEWSCKAHA